MKKYLTGWRERYAKVLKDYPELKETSNLSAISSACVSSEQKLQQRITAALICDNPYTYDSRNIAEYNLEICNTPSDKVYYSDSSISFNMRYLFRNRCFAPLYKIMVEQLEQIYFTL